LPRKSSYPFLLNQLTLWDANILERDLSIVASPRDAAIGGRLGGDRVKKQIAASPKWLSWQALQKNGSSTNSRKYLIF
jgi:hypothetical protein